MVHPVLYIVYNINRWWDECKRWLSCTKILNVDPNANIHVICSGLFTWALIFMCYIPASLVWLSINTQEWERMSGCEEENTDYLFLFYLASSSLGPGLLTGQPQPALSSPPWLEGAQPDTAPTLLLAPQLSRHNRLSHWVSGVWTTTMNEDSTKSL